MLSDLINLIVLIFKSPWLYGIFAFIGLFGYSLIKGTSLKKIPPFNNRKMLTWIGIFGVVATLGLFGSISLGTGSLASTAVVTSLQTTTAYTFDGYGYADDIADSGIDTTKMSDFYVNETHLAGNGLIENGVFLVTRSTGNTPAMSCDVRVVRPSDYEIEDETYHIVDRDATTNKMYAYVKTGTSSATAGPTNARESGVLEFAEGASQGYVAFNITIDETGFDPLTIHDYRDVRVDICGYPYVFRIHKDDA